MLPRVRFNVGDTVRLSRDRVGVIQYIGMVHNKYGEWYGIELQNGKNSGKNRGSIEGVFYFKTRNHRKNGMFVRLHQILYLLQRNQKKTKIKALKKKSKKIKNRNYIKSIIKARKNTQLQTTEECKQSLTNIPSDVLKYHILFPYFYAFEKFKLRMVCNDFNNILTETQNILLSSIESDINYWTTHSLSKYYKISPNYFCYLDLRHNRLSYLSKHEQFALKYFVIYHRNIENLLVTINGSECKFVKKKSESRNIPKMTEMTRVSFCNSSMETRSENLDFICDILQFYSCAVNVSCLKILDLNYIGLTDECLLQLSQALLVRDAELTELEYLLLLNNNHISDKYIPVLFKAIEQSLPNLLHLNFRRCNLSDVSCSIVLDYYLRNAQASIKHIDLELNSKITKIGTEKINKIFQSRKPKNKNGNNFMIHYNANKKSYCWECRTLYEQ